MTDNQEAVKKHQEILAKKDLIQQRIDEMKQAAGSVFYAIVATDDGFPVAYTAMDKNEATRKAAIAASLDGLSATISKESKLEGVTATHIECKKGFVFNHNITVGGNKKIVLLLAASSDDNMATLLWHIRKLSTSIQKDFEQ